MWYHFGITMVSYRTAVVKGLFKIFCIFFKDALLLLIFHGICAKINVYLPMHREH